MIGTVITGAGSLSACGDLDATLRAFERDEPALRPADSFDARVFGVTAAGEVPSFDARSWFPNPKALKLTDLRTRLTVAAAGMAVRDSGLSAAQLEAAGVVVGTSGADLQTEDVARALGGLAGGDPREMSHFAPRVLRKLNPLWLLVNLANMASAHVAIALQARGPNSTVTTDAAAGLQAIGEAARWVAGGEAEVVVAGGADTGVLPFAVGALHDSGLTGPDARSVPADGATLFTLESAEHARARGATVLGTVRGYASGCGGDIRRTMGRACREAGWEPSDVTVMCDAAVFTKERSDAKAFVRDAARIDVAHIAGHALAATAPLALAVALRRGAAIESVPSEERRGTPRNPRNRILVNAIGSAGQCATLAVEAGEAST